MFFDGIKVCKNVYFCILKCLDDFDIRKMELVNKYSYEIVKDKFENIHNQDGLTLMLKSDNVWAFEKYVNLDNKGLICGKAARYGALNILKYMKIKGCKINDYKIPFISAKYGNLSCLKYAFEKGGNLKRDVAEIAFKHGNFECFKYAIENKGDWTVDLFYESVARNDKYLFFKYLHEKGCMITHYIVELCMYSGNMDCMEYIYKQNYGFSEEIYYSAARKGYLNFLKFFNAKGLMKKTCGMLCIFAIEFGNLECLKYLHKNGYYCDEYTCAVAARTGNLEFLKYLHENGCPWDKTTIIEAYYRKNANCYEYAIQNGL